MLPLTGLILLGLVCIIVTGTFVFAIYHTTKTRLEARRLRDAEADSELRTPLRETAQDSGLLSISSTPLPPRPPTPEAEFPPPLPDSSDTPTKATERVQSMRAELSPPFLLPQTTYRPDPPPPPPSSPPRAPTPEADYPPPLPLNFPTVITSPLPPRSPLLPPPPSLPQQLRNHNAPKPRSRSRGRDARPKDDSQAQNRPDSMHEIYDIYSQLPPTPKVLPKSAPPSVVTFKQAESKWAYFGEKRAESRDRNVAENIEARVGMNMF